MKKINNTLKSATVAGLTAMALSSCASQNKAHKDNGTVYPAQINGFDESSDANFLILSDDERAAINNGNTFALNLFRTQTGMDSKVVSPLSVAYLMGMLANGADGNTYSEIMKTLGMESVSLQTLNASYKSIINMASRFDRQTSINIANCIALNKHVSVMDSYKKAVTEMYNADVESIDFASPSALRHINDWCSKQTDGMIPKIVDQLDANATAVLMNAIYFNGTWEKTFEKKNTKLEPFRGYTRGIKRVDMMQQSGKFYYTDNDDFAAVNLPYGNGTYSMTIILPKEGKSTSDIMGKLDANKFAEISKKMENCIVDLKLPRFSTSTETHLNKPISELGAPSIFLPGANFSKMSDTSMFVSSMIQKAKIEVSETGTKAAAVTAAIMLMSALPAEQPRHVVFHADHPFIYAITERNTGAIFFIGQYAGPEE